MKRLSIFVCSMLFSCSSMQVSHDYDKDVDWAGYKTYHYVAGAIDLPMEKINSERITQTIDQEMVARGLTKSRDPQLLIDLHIKVEHTKHATAKISPNNSGSEPYAFGPGLSDVNVEEYASGTLFINMVDTDSNLAIWQGRASKALDESDSLGHQEDVEKAIIAIFKKFPLKQRK